MDGHHLDGGHLEAIFVLVLLAQLVQADNSGAQVATLAEVGGNNLSGEGVNEEDSIVSHEEEGLVDDHGILVEVHRPVDLMLYSANWRQDLQSVVF